MTEGQAPSERKIGPLSDYNSLIRLGRQWEINPEQFSSLVQDAIKRRQSDLPKVETKIGELQRQLRQLSENEAVLSTQLIESGAGDKAAFMGWLEKQVTQLQQSREQKTTELEAMERYKAEIMRRSELDSLEDAVKRFRDRFDQLTGTEQRNLIEKLVKKIVVHKDNRIELVLFGEPLPPGLSRNTGRVKSTDSYLNGGAPVYSSVLTVHPLEILDSISYVHTALYRNKAFLHQKYVVEGLSLAQISELNCSSKDAVRKGLRDFGIPIRETLRPHGRPSQSKYGQKIQKGKLTIHHTEQRVINAIMEMKAQGAGLRQIARTLTQLGIPTKCRGKAWHPEMIRRVLAPS